MISAPRSVGVSVIFFPMGLFYYSSDNGSDYTISARNPTAASAMEGVTSRKSYPNGRSWLTTTFPTHYLASVQLEHTLA